MEKVFQVFKTHAEADEAEYAFYSALTPHERLVMCFELSNRLLDDPPQRLQRVYRTVKWEKR
jgi:hypothetical protein